MASGKIALFFAAAGLVAVSMLFIYLKINPPPLRGPHASYDQVYDYCTSVMPEPVGVQNMRKDSLYNQVRAIKPGDYPIPGGGHLYILGSGMFEILLPEQLQIVRNFGNVPVSVSSDNPDSIIGCTYDHLVQAIKTYGLSLPQN